MSGFYLDKSCFKYVNLCLDLNGFDDTSLISVCKAAVDSNLYSVTVPFDKVSNVWAWLEHSDVKIISVCNNFYGKYSLEQLYKNIKESFLLGADIVDVILPPVMFDLKNDSLLPLVDEYLKAIVGAKTSKSKLIQVSIESSFISNISIIVKVVELFEKYGIDIIKTSSGLYLPSSDLKYLYVILETIQGKNIGVNFLFDGNSKDKFILDDVARLYQSFIRDVEDTEQDKNKFLLSVNYKIFQNILQYV